MNNLTNLIAILVPSAIALEVFSRFNSKKKYKAKTRYYSFRIPNIDTNEFEYEGGIQINNSYHESGLKSHFDFLGIHENATPKEVKTARDKMILSWHPDKNDHAHADQMVQRINNSYKTIKQASKY